MSIAAGQRSKRKHREGKDEIPTTESGKEAATEVAVASSSKLSDRPTRGNGIGVGVGVGVGVGRVTRRSVANASMGVKGGMDIQAGGSSSGTQAEAGPSNHGRDAVTKSTKRSRKSRTSHTPPPAAQTTSTTKEHPQSTSLPHPPPNLPRRHLPYPIGLTPYRYTCLHPHLPAPPPGDPLDSNWKPYDPNHVSHLGPLPDSVRALSALGQDRPIIRPRGLRSSIPDKNIDPSLQDAEGSGSSGNEKRNIGRENGYSSNKHYPYHPHSDQSGIGPLDPSVGALPHPPIPSQSGPVSGDGDHSRPVDPSDPGFDIDTFLESATYESLTALLAAGDDVNGNATNGV